MKEREEWRRRINVGMDGWMMDETNGWPYTCMYERMGRFFCRATCVVNRAAGLVEGGSVVE